MWMNRPGVGGLTRCDRIGQVKGNSKVWGNVCGTDQPWGGLTRCGGTRQMWGNLPGERDQPGMGEQGRCGRHQPRHFAELTIYMPQLSTM
jgi:hypothetical protein